MQYVFIHGLDQNFASWNQTISCLSITAPITCPDLSLLVKDRAATYDNLYRAFSSLLSHRPGPFHLCGLLLGAVLALNYAIDNPEQMKSLVLVGAQYQMPQKMLEFQNVIFRFMPEAAFRKMGFSKN